MLRNQQKDRNRFCEKFGIKILNNIKDALYLDQINNDNLWARAIAKEMKNLDDLHTFKYYPPNKRLRKEDGWQYSLLQMIYEVKQQDVRRKARLVIG